MKPFLRADRLQLRYSRRTAATRGRTEVRALDEASLTLDRGAIVALVGRSGSGKSTLARCLALLERPQMGDVWFEGRYARAFSATELVSARRNIQLVFQEAAESVNPRFTVGETVEEPLLIARSLSRRERRSLALGLLEDVGLQATMAQREAHTLSGGQLRRLVLARALAAQPSVLILDETFTGLDLSAQARIANLLIRLRDRHDLTYLLISHDLRMASYLADRIAVLSEGRVVEQAAPEQLFADPSHPATQMLLKSARLARTYGVA